MKKNLAIILAAGSGSRFQGDTAKQFVTLDGRPLIQFSLDLFCQHPLIDGVIVVSHYDYLQAVYLFESMCFWLRPGM